MICAVCYGMLRGHQKSQWRGTFDLHFDHQVNRLELKKSADMSCAICRSILHELSRVEEKDQKSVISVVGEAFLGFLSGDVFRHQMHLDKAREALISAYLSELYGQEEPSVYRLDFKRRDSARVGTFVLQQIERRGDLGNGSNDRSHPLVVSGGTDEVQSDIIENRRLLHTPFSTSTSSDEALEVAKGWINDCLRHDHSKNTNQGTTKRFVPTRLIDLGAVPPSGKPGERENPEQVRLVLTAKEPPEDKDVYVTLSHCWGQAEFIRLEEGNESELRESIRLDGPTFPETFKDAIHFARRLGRKVRYIWIDSLCIIQGRTTAAREDWLHESAKMYEIYRNSYCNISATAALDSKQGLYHTREPRELWEDEINLNVAGIPGQTQQSQKHPIKHCSILDLSFWERNVDDAPVNRRAWVLQERLMAPRVLHFCQDQIAWECSELDAAESFRDGLPSYRLKGGDIVPGGRLKGLPESDLIGQGLNDQDLHMFIYQRWKRVVEVYSKTNLTNLGDKLIALSGIAKMMSAQVGETYVAGLWREYLASQLLWRVDPVYENGVFSNPSKRPKIYRAPSFSWAAIDAPQGITYGEITKDGKITKDSTEYGMLIEVEEENIVTETNDKFGLVKSGYIKVSGVLRKIRMKKIKNARYAWNLEIRSTKQLDEFRNVFLDSPESDQDIFGSEAHVYLLPARMDAKNYLICLLLQLERKDNKETGYYKRIGLTKVPHYIKSGQITVLKTTGEEATVPYGEWDARAQKHTVYIV